MRLIGKVPGPRGGGLNSRSLENFGNKMNRPLDTPSVLHGSLPIGLHIKSGNLPMNKLPMPMFQDANVVLNLGV